MIAEVTEFEGELVFDATRPDGQPRRCLDTTRAASLFGFRAGVSLREGLERTTRWFLDNLETASTRRPTFALNAEKS